MIVQLNILQSNDCSQNWDFILFNEAKTYCKYSSNHVIFSFELGGVYLTMTRLYYLHGLWFILDISLTNDIIRSNALRSAIHQGCLWICVIGAIIQWLFDN